MEAKRRQAVDFRLQRQVRQHCICGCRIPRQSPLAGRGTGAQVITVTRKLDDGRTVETSIEHGQAVDVITTPPSMPGLGAMITVLKPRPLTEAELLLADQHAVQIRL